MSGSMGRRPVITIDGPAGAGKSTVSKALAARFSYLYLDTGAFYRAIAYKTKKEGISPNDDDRLSEISRNINITLINSDGHSRVFVDDEEITGMIRTEEISMLASTVSARPCVREALLCLQREAAAQGGIVAEGRDMGTVVFPNADYKFYLDADISERAKRRYAEIVAKSREGDFEKIQNDLIIRDKQDIERRIAPLKPAATAVIIDTTAMTVEDIVDRIAELIVSREKPGSL
jgi:CMP/dCMP kinase